MTNEAQAGDVRRGTVTAIKDFGAYVDLGDAQGLVDVLEISWTRGRRIEETLREGQEVVVLVLGTDVRHGVLKLSLRALTPDPLLEFARESIGETVSARITHVGPVGVFAGVAGGLEGLILPRLPETAADDPQRRLQVGDEVRLDVAEVNTRERRISLALPSR